ncbi:type IX secretion system protein PorQ [Bacteroidota bacterium]
MCRFKLFSLLVAFIPLTTTGQIGGQNVFEYLNIPNNTRLAGLGGVGVAIMDWDVNAIFSNPASLNPEMDKHLSFNYLTYYANISLNSLAYAHEIEEIGMFSMGLSKIGYGKIDSYDPSGNPLGDFDTGEWMIQTGYARAINNFSMGSNIRLAISNIAGYRATALLLDIGGVFKHPEEDLRFGLVFKNVGFMISDYLDVSNSSLPFDVQTGMSYKPKYMPVRFHLTAYQLGTGDITYHNPDDPGDLDVPGTFDKVMSHIGLGGEFLISRNVNLRFGYNHLIRQELRLENTSGGAGFSGGFMFRIKAFEFSYTRSWYHVSGGINQFGLTSDFSSLFRKKTTDIKS